MMWLSATWKLQLFAILVVGVTLSTCEGMHMNNVCRQASHAHLASFSRLEFCGHNPLVPLKTAFLRSSSTYFYIDKRGKRVFNGKIFGFFGYLNEAFGWTFDLVEPPDRVWGRPSPNGSFNGLLGMVQRTEADMAIGSLLITHSRKKAVEFSHPYYYDSMRLLSHKPSHAPKWEVLAWPYQINSWIAIISSFLLSAVLIYGVFKLAQDESYTFAKCVMECYKQYLGASTNQWPEKRITKTVFTLWCLTSLVLSKAYSGSLLSQLTKQVTVSAIDTLEDLRNSKYHEVALGVRTKGTLNMLCTTSGLNGVCDKFKGRLFKSGAVEKKLALIELPGIVMTQFVEMIELDVNQVWGLPAGKTFIHWSKELLLWSMNGIALQKGTKLKPCIDEKVLRSREAGLWYKWRLDGIHTYRMKFPVPEKDRKFMADYMLTLPSIYDENKALSLEQMQTAFYIYLGMVIMAFSAFIIENWACLNAHSSSHQQQIAKF